MSDKLDIFSFGLDIFGGLLPAVTLTDNVTVADTKAINTGLADDDYFTIGAVDNDDNLIDVMIQFQGAAAPYFTVGAPTAYKVKFDPAVAGIYLGDGVDSWDAIIKWNNTGTSVEIRNVGDTDYDSFRCEEFRFQTQLIAVEDGAIFRAANSDNYYLMFQARDNGNAVVEVARMQGAADPYFSIGGSQNIKGYYSGKFALVEQAAALADVAGEGQFWVKNDTPNTPYFTDDAGTDHAIITGATATKHEFHMPFEDPTGVVGNWDVVAINAAQDTHFVFQVPESFQSLVNAKVVMIPDATETIQWDINVSVSAAGEAYNNDDRTAADQTLAVTQDNLTEIDISGQLTGLAGGDYVAIDFQSDIADLRIIGFEFDYL